MDADSLEFELHGHRYERRESQRFHDRLPRVGRSRAFRQNTYHSIWSAIMDRRSLLISVGGATSLVAGCLGTGNVREPADDGEVGTTSDETDDANGGDGDTEIDPEFERCDDRIIPYTRLPEEPREEAGEAFETRVYETDGETARLRLEETTPTWPGTHDLVLVNETDDSATVSIVVRDEDGDVVFEDDVETKPDDEVDVTDRPPFP
ncbi:hypothetical protein D8S78_05270 [Natrialba swarupiae]|nr:hypothetical protein [Natrialba swarupiae]